MKVNNKLFIIGTSLALIGLIGLIPSAYFLYQSRQITRAAVSTNAEMITKSTVPAVPDITTGKPVTLSIPSLNLKLPVADGIFNPKSGQWTLSNDKVHYALMTMQPNDTQGNTLIYGHYRPGVFSTLKTIKQGSEVSITTENGYLFTYSYTGNQVVSPADGSIFSYEGKPKLTLQTCTGAFMQNRQLFSFEYLKVSKA